MQHCSIYTTIPVDGRRMVPPPHLLVMFGRFSSGMTRRLRLIVGTKSRDGPRTAQVRPS